MYGWLIVCKAPFPRPCDGLWIIRSGDVADGVVILQFTLFPSNCVWLQATWLSISPSGIDQMNTFSRRNNQIPTKDKAYFFQWSLFVSVADSDALYLVRFDHELACCLEFPLTYFNEKTINSLLYGLKTGLRWMNHVTKKISGFVNFFGKIEIEEFGEKFLRNISIRRRHFPKYFSKINKKNSSRMVYNRLFSASVVVKCKHIKRWVWVKMSAVY